jgi:isochorismate synthase
VKPFAYLYNPYLDRASYYTLHDHHLGEQLHLAPWQGSRLPSYVFYLSPPFSLGSSWDYPSSFKNCQTISRDEHIAYVQGIVDHLSTSGVKKVVAARQKLESLPKFSIEDMLHQLVGHFPKTFVYAFYTPDAGLWVGASPELLGYVVQNNFTTISLAGTIDGGESFQNKEINEERWVRDYMYQILLQYSHAIQEHHSERPFGAIKHLVTEFQSVLNENTNFESLIQEIHPSPALSGYPKKEAIEYIQTHEPMDRRYYTGHIVQRIDADHQYAFGLIRTALCDKEQMVLYAGGGITIDSDPATEYEETEKKMNSLSQVLMK